MDVPDLLSDVCSPWGGPLERQEAETLASVLKALADPVRLRLISLILSAEDGGHVSDLKHAVGLAQPTVSHHLRIMTEAGLLEREKAGVYAIFRVRAAMFAQIADLITPPRTRSRRRS